MAATINADNGVVSGSAGLKSTADTSGVLALQSNGTTGLTLNTSLALGVGSGNSTGSSGQVLTSAGSGAAPTWSAVPATTPAGSTGQVQYNNAGAFGAISSGTSGQVLTSAGSGAAPTWASPAAGGSWIYLSTVSASGASTVNVVTTFDSTYDMYAIVATGVYFNTATVMGIRFNLGGSYASSGYSYAFTGVNSNTGSLIDRTTSWNKINMTPISSGYTDYPMSFIAYVSNPWNQGGSVKQIWGEIGFAENNGYTCMGQFSGTMWNDFSALTGVQFLAANGSSTITGKFRLYGIKNS